MESNIEKLPYQPHSQTSIDAARRKNNAGADRLIITELIHKSGTKGRTNDEISAILGKNSSFYSPRLIELERAGHIIKLKETRKTRSNRRANVYVCPLFTFRRETITVKREQKIDPLLNQMDIKVIHKFIIRVDTFGSVPVFKDGDVYKAIKRLAGI